MKRGAGIACALMLVAVATTSAQTFSLGDIAITGRRLSDNRGVLVVHHPDGTFARTMVDASGSLGDIGFGSNGLLYAAGGSIIAYAASGTAVYVFPQEPQFPDLVDLTFARDGRVYAFWTSNRVVTYTAQGTRLAGFDLPGNASVSSIDLAADQCTLYFTIGVLPMTFESAVGRVNLCTVTPLAPQFLRMYPSLATLSPWDVRVLPNGQLLVARRLAGVEILDTAGNVVRSFTTPATELAIAPDGRSFYASMGAAIQRVDLLTGTVLQTIPTGIGIRGITVVGDPRAAFADAVADVPTVSPGLLVLLAVALGGLAFVILRRS